MRVVLHPFHSPGLDEVLRDRATFDLVMPEDDGTVVSALREGARGLITFRWSDDFLVEGLEWIQALSAGVDQFPLEVLEQRGIALTSARGAHSPAVAEHAVALAMALVRGVGPSLRHAPERRWEPVEAYELAGRTMGIVGLGSIGEEVAWRAAGLGMDVIGVKRTVEGYRGAASTVLGPEGLLEVCARADVLVVALPEVEATEGLIGRRELDALGEGWLVNVGRGSVVDEEALVAALVGGRLRGAGLDVAAVEPLPDDSALWDLDNVVVTPHMAWSSDRLAGRLADMIVENAAALASGAPLSNRVA